MDKNSEIIENFESLLKKQPSERPLRLYSVGEHQNKPSSKPTGQISYSAKEILEKVSKQIKAMQNADTASYKRVGNTLDKYKTRGFLSVDMIPVSNEVHQNRPSHFETQCISDTQLINIVDNAEIIDKHKGVTQEFDSTFCQISDGSASNDERLATNGIDDVMVNDKHQSNKEVTSEMDTLLCLTNDVITDADNEANQGDQKDKINPGHETYDKTEDTERSTSPILNAKTRVNTPPLVYSLYAFEKFENLAHPIIEEHVDLETAKNLINSQIIGKELFIPNHTCQNNDRQSPVLSKVDNINLLTDDSVSKDAKLCTEELLNNSINKEKAISPQSPDVHDNNVAKPSQPKLSMKAEFEDEILFSSDEEYEYLHKEIQELPITCALETSFYDKSDVLDKTMYVGFQTASNKSIQISTNSFSKAKNILSDVDSNEASLKDLVEIFDTVKERSGTLTSNLSNCKEICNIKDENLIETKTYKDTELKAETGNRCEEERGDTFKNISLTPLEQNEEMNNVVMSQIIEFKSISRGEFSKMNTSASKVISQNTKRKLEGFKTASNKKIKLSEKALARCKKVFQDIDLEDHYENDHCKLDNNIKEKENKSKDETPDKDIDISQDIFEISDHNFKTEDKKCKEEVLQINDQVILQEFEENDMAFQEANSVIDSREDITTSEGATAKFKDTNTNEKYRDYKPINLDTTRHSDHNDNVFKKPIAGFRTQVKKQSKGKIIPGTKMLHCFEVNKPKNEENNHKDDFHFDKPSSSKFIGFKTAANKEIKISKQALEKTRNFYKDVDQEFVPNKINVIPECIEKGGNDFIDTEDFLGEELALNEDLFKENIENKEPAIPLIKDASKKAISISDKSFAKSQKLFDGSDNICNVELQNEQEYDKDSDKDKNAYNKPQKCHEHKDFRNEASLTSVNMKSINTEHITKDKGLILEANKHKNQEAPIFKGFLTASNKKVQISEEALVKSKKIFHDLDLSQTDKVQTETTAFKSLQAPSNKNVAFADEDLRNSKTLVKKTDFSFENNQKFVGFKTASSKPINISAKALAKIKQVFNNDEFQDFGNQVENDYEQVSQQKSSASKFVGFQTASNKEVHISADSLAKSRQMLNCVELEENFVKFSNNDDRPLLSKFVGFHTASNKQIKISDEALARTKTAFDDIDNFEKENIASEITEQERNVTPIFKGFQTASNKRVQISDKALKTSKGLFQEMDKMKSFPKSESNSEKYENNKVFHGFQTASNKKVEISEKALAKCKKLFEDMELSQLNDYDKEIEIVENDTIASKINDSSQTETNNNFDQLHKNCDGTSFKGCQTANNKKVEISDKALEASKELFQDMDKCVSFPKFDSVEAKLENNVFRGFQTASNKKVKISEKALTKSKKLFEDIELSQLNKDDQEKIRAVDEFRTKSNTTNINQLNHEKNCGGISFKEFQRASNKKDVMSDQGLAKTEEKILIPNNNSRIKGLVVQTINEANRIPINSNKIIPGESTKDIIDTQVLNDFQDSLHTEDFCKSTPTSKRSGSPILSCPKAKKRRFETPYKIGKKLEPKIAFVPPKLAKTYKFKDDYKKNKEYTLKDLQMLEKNQTKVGIEPYISKFNFENLLKFELIDARNDYTKGKVDVDQIKKIFLDSVNKKIVPDGWVENHVQLILWKLLSYEIKFPNVMKNTCTVRNVLEQLKYRYDRELYNVQRPILRKILEKDEVASKTMVLCVAGIYVDNISVTSVATETNNIELLLTDGWYCLKACIDRLLCSLVCNNTIMVGCKIITYGAELIGCEQGKAPWEDTSSVRLKLSGNSTRLGRWWWRLGARGAAPPAPLGAARAAGGRASLRARVARRYPPLYVERMPDGSTVTLSERLEHIRQMKYEAERQIVMEKLYEELEKEVADQESQDSEGYSNEKTNCLESGSQISKLMKKSRDPDEYRAHLTKSQHLLLEEHNSRKRDKQIEDLRVKFQEKLEKNGLKTERNVVPLLKVRVADFRQRNCGVEVSKGYLSIWKPSAAVVELVTEGTWIEILNVIPTGFRNSEIQLSAGRQTIFNPHKLKTDKFKLHMDSLMRKCYEIKDLSQNPTMTTDYNEIDTVGMIFLIEPSTKEFDEKQNFQNVYLADADKNMICVNFWGGLKKFGFENILDTGQIITCVNLQKRAGNTRKSIPQYRVTELSYFTKTPKDKRASELTSELSNKLSKIRDKFCDDCVALKNNYSIFKTRNNENTSPYRFDNNLSRNSIESPFRDANLNLTGLDFESSFKETELSPMALLRKKQVNEKIKKLKMYGEPSPLSSIHIINKSKNASATYKSPLIQKSNIAVETKAASVEKDLQNVTSPIKLNRTYVKNINPVKLNFSNSVAMENNLNDSGDHFAEDFDASPPLSLDSDVV